MIAAARVFRIGVIALAALAWVAGTLMYLNRAGEGNRNDFWVYYRTAQRMDASQWDRIYDLRDGGFPFRYAPPTLPAFSPLTKLSERDARYLWTGLQAALFALGFLALFLSLRELGAPDPLFRLSLTFLLALRYYLDSLYSGQVSGILFLCFSAGMLLWIRSRTAAGSLVILPAILLKIGPGILSVFFLCQAGLRDAWRKVIATSLGAFLLANAIALAWLPRSASLSGLWRSWLAVVVSDGDYYDGSCPKSQALRGFLLRTFGRGPGVERLWGASALLCLGLILAAWAIRGPATPRRRALGYSLGLIGFVLLMPQSLPYALVHLAIPVAVLLGASRGKLAWEAWAALIAFALFCSIPGSDVVGFHEAEWIQARSLPFFAVLGILAVTAKVYRQDPGAPARDGLRSAPGVMKIGVSVEKVT